MNSYPSLFSEKMRGPARKKERDLHITGSMKMSKVSELRTPGGPPPGLDRTRTRSSAPPTTNPYRGLERGGVTVYRKSTNVIPEDPIGLELDRSSGGDNQTGISRPLNETSVHQELRLVSGLQRELEGGWVHNLCDMIG